VPEFRNVLLPNSNQSRIRALTAPAGGGAGNPPCYWYSVSPDLQEQMSEEHSSAETSELARLRALVAEYETKMTDAAALVARVRHEINNPLAALLGQAQLLLREELSDKARGRVQIIEELAKRIEKIGSELRDVQTPVAAVNRAEE
jgi:signal transduction histidine kinase